MGGATKTLTLSKPNASISLFTARLRIILSYRNIYCVCILLLVIAGIQKATASPFDVRRVWYESSGIDERVIKKQIETFKQLGVQRVHLVVTHRFDEVGRYCECAREVYGVDVALGICKDPKKRNLVPANDPSKNLRVNVCAAKEAFFCI